MRRPLATIGLFFIFILLIIQLIFPSEPTDYSRFDGDTVSATGTLTRIEYKKKDDQLRTIWYLSDVKFEPGKSGPSGGGPDGGGPGGVGPGGGGPGEGGPGGVGPGGGGPSEGGPGGGGPGGEAGNHASDPISLESKDQILCYMDDASPDASPYYSHATSMDYSRNTDEGRRHKANPDSMHYTGAGDGSKVNSDYNAAGWQAGGLQGTVSLGSTVTVRGRIRTFTPPTNPGQFDMPKYYDMSHIVFSLTSATAQYTGSDPSSVNNPATQSMGSNPSSVNNPATQYTGSDPSYINNPATQSMGSAPSSVNNPATQSTGSDPLSINNPATQSTGSAPSYINNPATLSTGSAPSSINNPATLSTGSDPSSVNNPPLRSTAPSSLSLGWRIRDRLAHIRYNIGLLCDMCMNESDSSVIKAMLLGDKSSMDPDTRSLYSRNGIAHILAISGLHISMLGMGLVTVMKKMRIPTPVSAGTAIVMMIMYGLMTGMAASAARAVIMFSLRMLADIVHRTYDMATALVIAAVLVLIEQPAYLFYSGFQFSFGAITAVILILPLLEDVFPKLLSGCISINIVTLPIYLWNYYYFPLISVILNLYIIPMMSVLLGCAIMAVAGCALYIPLGKVLTAPIHLILMIYEWSCRIADKLPINRYVPGKPGVVNIILYIAIISAILLLRRYQTRLQVMMHLVFACIMLTARLRAGVDITLIDVGQGDGIHITDNCGTDILIDGGSSDVKDVGAYRIGPYLYSQGVSQIDAAFITHLDADHYNGILEMLLDGGVSMPHIDTLYLTSSSVMMGGDAYEALVEAAGAGYTEVCTVTAGDVFRTGTLMFTCLYPDSGCRGEDTNNESLVLDMVYEPGIRPYRTQRKDGTSGGKTGGKPIHMLFTGDLGGAGETALTEKIRQYLQPDDYLILKCAHHGSKYSTYESFIEKAGPDLVLISAGHDNSYGHPNTETLERLDKRNIPHYCTIDHGALDVHITGNDIEVIPYLKPE